MATNWLSTVCFSFSIFHVPDLLLNLHHLPTSSISSRNLFCRPFLLSFFFPVFKYFTYACLSGVLPQCATASALIGALYSCTGFAITQLFSFVIFHDPHCAMNVFLHASSKCLSVFLRSSRSPRNLSFHFNVCLFRLLSCTHLYSSKTLTLVQASFRT